jgi:hypothetical protein
MATTAPNHDEDNTNVAYCLVTLPPKNQPKDNVPTEKQHEVIWWQPDPAIDTSQGLSLELLYDLLKRDKHLQDNKRSPIALCKSILSKY